MFVVLIVCAIAVIFVLGLSIMTINKGYGYQHKVDPIPEELKEEENKDDRQSF